MTKIEAAKAVASHMNKINKNVDIDKTAEMLNRRMSKRELEKVLKNYEK